MSHTPPDINGGAIPTLSELPDIANDDFSGRGIVICAGGVGMFTNAWVLVWVLRKVLNCTLPIEIWHLGPREMSQGMRRMLESLGATTVDAHSVLSRYPAKIHDGWQLKAYALIRSSFREVLLLDADNVPVTDPACLFDRPEYIETGAIFWPDFVDLAATNPIWQLFGLPSEQRISFESGQVLIDKSRHGDALKILLYLNEQAERFYQLIYGDKDTFLVAWLATQSDFSQVPHRPMAERYITYQRDFDGDVLFQHKTGRKWHYTDADPYCGVHFVHESDCLAALAELRRIWNGRIYDPPSRSLAARQLESELTGQLFIVSPPGEDDRQLELLGGSQIGRGRGPTHQTWHVVDLDSGGFALRISDYQKVRHEFRRSHERIWTKLVIAGTPDTSEYLVPLDESETDDRMRDVGLVRDIVHTVLAEGPWSKAVADRLRTTFEVLSMVEPTIADDLHDFAAATFADGSTKEGLLRLAAGLNTDAGKIQGDVDVRSAGEVFGDPNLYVRP
jgi:hypothetical protein